MPSSVDQRISALKIAAWALRIMVIIVLAATIVQTANFILYLIGLNGNINLDQVATQIVTQFVPLLLAVGLLQWGSERFFNQVDSTQAELEEKLVGYISTNQSMPIETISKWIGLPQRKAADQIARLAAQGKLSGYTIDLPSQTVYLNSAAQRPANPQYNAPSPSPMRGTTNLTDEAVKIKAKLYELDMLKKQGRISEDEYNEMKGDLERKLVNLDSGTQVY